MSEQNDPMDTEGHKKGLPSAREDNDTEGHIKKI